ncbi:MAG: transposase [Actinomycetota bacterium]|nr:transposase [Actinomycetota bacterium]
MRDLVEDLYAACGRPSVDPVVFFKLQLVLFFEDLRSERLLMEIVADRLSIRWYLGYDLDEPRSRISNQRSPTYVLWSSRRWASGEVEVLCYAT